MRKLVVFAGMALCGWLAASVAWAVTARVVDIPGPARLAYASADLAADAIEATELPGPLSFAQHALGRQMRRGGAWVSRLYRAPERLADRLVGGGDLADRRTAAGPAPRGLGAFGPGEAPVVLALRVEAEVERALRARLERLRDVEVRVQTRLRAAERRVEERRVRVERRRSELEERLEDLDIRIRWPEDGILLEGSAIRIVR